MNRNNTPGRNHVSSLHEATPTRSQRQNSSGSAAATAINEGISSTRSSLAGLEQNNNREEIVTSRFARWVREMFDLPGSIRYTIERPYPDSLQITVGQYRLLIISRGPRNGNNQTGNYFYLQISCVVYLPSAQTPAMDSESRCHRESVRESEYYRNPYNGVGPSTVYNLSNVSRVLERFARILNGQNYRGVGCGTTGSVDLNDTRLRYAALGEEPVLESHQLDYGSGSIRESFGYPGCPDSYECLLENDRTTRADRNNGLDIRYDSRPLLNEMQRLADTMPQDL